MKIFFVSKWKSCRGVNILMVTCGHVRVEEEGVEL